MMNKTKIIFMLIGIFFVWNNIGGEGYANGENIKVSVIVPVYNVERYVSLCLESLVSQTLKDIEIICIDDGSTDRSGKILDEYAKKDSRIIVIHQKNSGLSAARNRGLEYGPRGEYVTFVDSDDYIDKDTYKVMYDVAKAHDNDVVAFGFRAFTGKGKCTIWNRMRYRFQYKNMCKELKENKDYRIIASWCWHCTNKLYKTELIKKNKVRFLDEAVACEDIIYNFMVTPHIKKYESVDKIFYNYRKHSKSITAKGKNNPNSSNCIKAIPAICNKWRECGILSGNEEYVLNTLIRVLWGLMEDVAKEDANYANEIAESFGKDIYNANVLVRCNKYTKDLVEELEQYRGAR